MPYDQTLTDPATTQRAGLHIGAATSAAGFPARSPGVPPELMLAAFDEIAHGMVLLESSGAVCWANRTALRHLHRPGALALQGQRLVAESSQDEQALDRALANACQGRRSMTMVGRGERATMLALVPLATRTNAGSHFSALMVMGRREPCEPLSLQFFCSTHQLTPAEAAILDALNRGCEPSQVAASGRVALSTVRSHISAMRQKTGARSIRHLLRIVAGLPPLVSAIEDRMSAN